MSEALAAIDSFDVEQKSQLGQPIELRLPSGKIEVKPTDYVIEFDWPADWYGVVVAFDFVVSIDARITPELAREGMAREIVRHVQNSRKDADLQMEDCIILYLQTDDADLAKAVAEHREYIAAETLVANWSDRPLGEGAYRTHMKVDGKPLTIELRKA